MNPFSLYVQISRLVFQFEKTDQNWQQLKKLVPYLRVSLQCVICRELLRTPYKNYCCTNCHYNVCELCLSKITNIRIPCNWCNENKKYDENVQLRILLQCYKSLCDYIQNNQLFQDLFCSKDNTYPTSPSLSISSTNDLFLPPQPSSLKELIEEGASYGDEFKLGSGQTFTSILPTYTSTGTQTINAINNNNNITCNNSNSSTINSVSNNINTNNNSGSSSISINSTINLNNNNNNTIINTEKIALMTTTTATTTATTTSSSTSNPLPHPPIKTVSNGSSLYSVMYAGSGNKITIKRKTDANIDDDSGCGASGGLSSILNNSDLNSFKKPNTSSFTPVISSNVGTSSAGQKSPSKNLLKRKGCRCGNATPTPGKLTCCGQRCPCYVESKSCIDCKCRGCRNPHRPNGQKVRPHIPELENLEFTLKETKIIEHFNNSNNSTNNSICLNQRSYRVNNHNQQTTQFFQQPPQQQQQQQQQQLQKQQLHQTIQQQIQQKQNLKQQQQLVHQNQQSLQKQQNVQQQLLHTNQIHQTLQKHQHMIHTNQIQQPMQKQQLIHTNQVQQPVLKQQQHQHLQLPQQTVTTTAPLILNSNSLSNGTIQVVGVYTTHLPTETALPSILMDDYTSSVIPSSNLLNHSLFNNSNNLSTSCETNALINNKPNIMNYDDSSLDDMNNVEID